VTEPRKRSAPATARIAERVREARRANGWSQEQLARALQLAGRPTKRETIAELETGRRHDITVSLLLALATVLRTPAAELLASTEQCAVCRDRPQRGLKCMTCGREGSR
jgi:transcriptional regulator with XRE-family HTH domain